MSENIITKDEVKLIEQNLSTKSIEEIRKNNFLEVSKLIRYYIHQGMFSKAYNLVVHHLSNESKQTPFFSQYYCIVLANERVSLLYESFEKFILHFDKIERGNQTIELKKNIAYSIFQTIINRSKSGILDISSGILEIYKRFDEYFQEKSVYISNEIYRYRNTLIDLEYNRLSRIYDNLMQYYTDVVINDVEEEANIDSNFDFSNYTILILGDFKLERHIIEGIFKAEGFSKDNLILELEYNKLPNFDIRKYNYSNSLKGIIVGAVPHKMKNIGENSTLVNYLRGTEGYPYTVESKTQSGVLKGSKQGLKEAIKELKRHLIAVN